MSSMIVKGNRWATTLTADLWTFLNHAEEAVPAGVIVYLSSTGIDGLCSTSTSRWRTTYH